jgi:hypothetical protein
MANIVAGDLTYTIKPYPAGSRLEGSTPRYKNLVTIAFGGGSESYPANGVPLLGASLGMPQAQVEKLLIVEAIGGLPNYWTYDSAHNTLRAVVFSTGVEVATNASVAATTLVVEAQGY